jgi:hypothetical protein
LGVKRDAESSVGEFLLEIGDGLLGRSESLLNSEEIFLSLKQLLMRQRRRRDTDALRATGAMS